MTRFVAAACAIALLLGCSGKSESDGAGTGGNGGKAGGAGGTADAGHAATSTGGSGALAGRAGAGGSGAGSGNGSSGTSGTSGASGGALGGSAGSGGSGKSGAGGRAGGSGGAGASGAGAAGAGTGGSGAGDAGAAGAAGESGMRCGGMEGLGCPTFEYCDFGGLCTFADAEGVCRSTSTETCGAERVCGCDGKIYANDCRAHSAGVDTTDSSHCVTGNGDQGAACVVDDDCTGELKCCSSPIGIVSCTTPMGNGCPLTP